jgi:hypothetical protein
MEILENHEEKIIELVEDCYKIKCEIQYESDTLTSGSATSGLSLGQEMDKDKGKSFRQQAKVTS